MASLPDESKIKIPLTLGAVTFMAIVVWQLAAVYNRLDSAGAYIRILDDNFETEIEVLQQRMEKRYARLIGEIGFLKSEIHDQRDVIAKIDKEVAVMKALNQKWNIE